MFVCAQRPREALIEKPVTSFGKSVDYLYGPWKFQAGDSPLDPTTHTPLWATSTFDDSKWENVDLSPEAVSASTDPMAEFFQTVPGWGARGHSGYWGYAWYRIRLRVQIPQSEHLAFAGPNSIDDGYQLLYDGRLVGSFGDFTGDPPVTGNYQPTMFLLPSSSHATSGPVDVVIALRVWMHPGTLTFGPSQGGLRSAPILGEAGAVKALYQMKWVQSLNTLAAYPIGAVAFAAFAFVAFSLILFDRSDSLYIWIGCVFLLQSCANATTCLYYSTPMSGLTANLLTIPMSALIGGGWTMIWWKWFGIPRRPWLPYAILALVLVNAVVALIGFEQFFTVVPHAVAIKFYIANLILRFVLALLLIWIAFQGVRRQDLEGWLVLPALLLQGIAYFGPDLIELGVKAVWFPFGVYVDTPFLASLLLLAAVAMLLLRRLTFSLRHQREVALDVKQAQEVQRVLLPKNISLPNLFIQTEYLPAREVGGDFFQIIPDATDGSVLIVAGDVTGKGLQAGMLVAVLVGAIRMAVESITEPAAILEMLNRRLLGRESAFATCLALKIETNGTVTLANAGHLAPYLNGKEVPMEGALPLGMISEADFPTSSFRFDVGESLTLISDGILEAQDKTGELFGFDRIRETLIASPGATYLANAARSFGQNDDITVLNVIRNV